MCVPPGGWTWVVPETGFLVSGGNFRDLVRVVQAHYCGNGIACDDAEQRVEQGLCERLLAMGAGKEVIPDPVIVKAEIVPTPKQTLTIAYITNRLDCHIEWFLQSLNQQAGGLAIPVIAVDYFKDQRTDPIWEMVTTHVAPKPNVWSGPHRLTKVDYFTAANSRNTAICLCESDWIAFVDDLSVLLPGWLNSVYQAMTENYIALGSYKKVRQLKVSNGIVQSFDDYPGGWDSRLQHVHTDLTSCAGNWLFGCSFAAPLDALLDVGGVPELCDSTGLGSEDYCLGIALANRGNAFRYDRRMMTLESEEHHHAPGASQFKRSDKGVSPHDKSHAMLARAQQTSCYNTELRALHNRVVAGEPFPIPTEPTVDWFDQQPLSEL